MHILDTRSDAAVVRVSCGSFDPARFAEVREMTNYPVNWAI